MYSGVGSAVGTGLSGYAQNQNATEMNNAKMANDLKIAQINANKSGSDRNMKENIDESGDEVQKFMDRISNKFRK